MKNLVITLSLLSLFLISCTQYYYAPNVQNVPLFTEKNDLRLAGSYGFGVSARYLELQSAYSASNHIGVMLNFMRASETIFDTYAGKGYYYEGAVGYYKPIKPDGSFEVYGGFAISDQHHKNGSSGGDEYLTFTKMFIQPSIGSTANGFDIAFSTRFSRVAFNKIDYTNFTYINSPSALDDLTNNKVSFLLEPALTTRMGWKNFKIQAQFQRSINLTNSDLPFELYNINFGIYITIADKYRKPPIKAAGK